MPGYAFHLETLKQVASKLSGSDPHTAGLLDTPYARLGAFGPDLLMYAPPSQQLAGDVGDSAIFALAQQPASQLTPAQQQELVELFQKPVGAAYSALFSQLVIPSWPQLSTVISFIAEANSIAQSEDSSALSGFFGQLPAVQSALTSLGTSLPAGIKALADIVGALIKLGPWMETAGLGALLLPAANTKGCRTYEFLRWHKSCEFAAALMNAASSEHQQAFALGWLSHVAASVTGEPFINNIAGGPYRTHWWRNRMAQNFVDAWTWGRFETSPPASMAGDEPTPAYEQWAPLPGANLQDLFNVGHLPGPASAGALPSAVTAMATGDVAALAASFPTEITDLLATALAATYPSGSQPVAPDALSADEFASAYVGAYSVFWFLTSGEGPLGNNALGPPPSGCGTTAPPWTSSGSSPPPQSQGVTSGSTACEVILAILAVLAFLTGNTAAGIALLVAALEEQPSIDWDTVRCDVHWVTFSIDKIENLLRDALVISTLAYPPPILLGGPDTNGHTQPATDFTNGSMGDPPQSFPDNAPPSGGVALTRTNSTSEEEYPRQLDTSLLKPDLDWLRYPTNEKVEEPSTRNLIPSGKYPDFVLNGAGLVGPGMMDPGVFPTRVALFGDAVSNAVKLIEAQGQVKANYNLDGDRGYGWQGWHPTPLTNPANPPVQAKQD